MSEVIAATASVAAMEDRLLTAAHAERMLVASTVEDAINVLHDLGWASDLAEQEDKTDFESLLRHGLWSVQQGILHTGVSAEVRELIFLPFDYQNVITTVMALSHGQKYTDVSEGMSNLGFFSKNAFFRIAEEQMEGVSLCADYWSDSVRKAVATLNRDKELTDEVVENLSTVYFGRMIELSRHINDSVITQYVDDLVNIHNAKTLVRRSAEVSTYYNAQSILPFVDTQISADAAAIKVGGSVFADDYREGMDLVKDGGDIATWELGLDLKLCSRVVDTTLANLLGPGRVLQHWLVKSRNAEIIRTILVAKANGMSDDELRIEIAPFLSLLVA